MGDAPPGTSIIVDGSMLCLWTNVCPLNDGDDALEDVAASEWVEFATRCLSLPASSGSINTGPANSESSCGVIVEYP